MTEVSGELVRLSVDIPQDKVRGRFTNADQGPRRIGLNWDFEPTFIAIVCREANACVDVDLSGFDSDPYKS